MKIINLKQRLQFNRWELRISREALEKRINEYYPLVEDDVVTTGGSTLKACRAVEEEGGKVVLTLTLVDRLEGGRENLEEKGYRFISLLTRDDLLK